MRILIVLLFMFLSTHAYAQPSQADTDTVNAEFDTRDSYQSSYYTSNSDYEQKLVATVSGIDYTTHIYDGPSGKGYVHTAKKNVSGTDYIMQRHSGSETRSVLSSWTSLEE